MIPFALAFSVVMLRKEYHEHLTGGATVGVARNAEFLSAAQLLLFGALYGISIASIRRRDVATHMRCMICIVLVLLPAGLARTLGYWFLVRQSWSQTICLALIDTLLLALIAFDMRRRLAARPYALVLFAYVAHRNCLDHSRATRLKARTPMAPSFSSGHGFSRAIHDAKSKRLQPLRERNSSSQSSPITLELDGRRPP